MADPRDRIPAPWGTQEFEVAAAAGKCCLCKKRKVMLIRIWLVDSGYGWACLSCLFREEPDNVVVQSLIVGGEKTKKRKKRRARRRR